MPNHVKYGQHMVGPHIYRLYVYVRPSTGHTYVSVTSAVCTLNANIVC